MARLSKLRVYAAALENEEEMPIRLSQKYQDRVIIGSSVIYLFVYSFDKYLRVYCLGTVIHTRNTAKNKT